MDADIGIRLSVFIIAGIALAALIILMTRANQNKRKFLMKSSLCAGIIFMLITFIVNWATQENLQEILISKKSPLAASIIFFSTALGIRLFSSKNRF